MIIQLRQPAMHQQTTTQCKAKCHSKRQECVYPTSTFTQEQLFAQRSAAALAVMACGKQGIVVVHATSKQGTSVVNSLLQTSKFAVKALTRDANSESAPLAAC